MGSTAMSHSGPLPLPDHLAVVEHRRVVLLPLADHDRSAEGDGSEEAAHGIHGRAVGAVLVPTTDEGHRPDGRGLGRPDEFQSQVAVRLVEQISGCGGRHDSSVLAVRNGVRRGWR